MSEEKKRKKSSRANTQDCTNAKGASDSPTADKPAATKMTSLSAPPPGSTPRMITTLRARVALTMQPFDPRLLMILLVEVSHGDRDWLYQPGLSLS